MQATAQATQITHYEICGSGHRQQVSRLDVALREFARYYQLSDLPFKLVAIYANGNVETITTNLV